MELTGSRWRHVLFYNPLKNVSMATKYQCDNRRIVMNSVRAQWAFDAGGGSDWTFCSACVLLQDHPHNVGVPPDPLPALLRLLLLQRADACAAGPARVLGRSHPANGRQVPAQQRTNRTCCLFVPSLFPVTAGPRYAQCATHCTKLQRIPGVW